MFWLVIITCIFAGAFNAGSTLLEREATRKPDLGKLFSLELSKQVIQSRNFLLGLLLQVCASGMEVIALSQGSLIVVGPLLTLDIVFLWLFISYHYHLKVKYKSWAAMALVLAGISAFFVSAQPSDRSASDYIFRPVWLIIVGSVFGLIALAYVMTKESSSERLNAAVLGVATASNYAINGALVKLLFLRLHSVGLGDVLISWPFYALIFFIILSIVLTQNTFSAGPVTISQPIIEVVQAVGSVIMGVFIFDGVIKHSWISLIGIGFGLVITSIGITMLASSESQFTSKEA